MNGLMQKFGEIGGNELVCYGGDGSKCSIMFDDERKDFLKKAGKNAKALSRENWILLYYNTDTGDILIPKAYNEEEVIKIKKAFLRFISRDNHEDVPHKTVEIED